MSRRIMVLFAAITLVTSLSLAETSGFDSKLEEAGFAYPPSNVPLLGDFAAPVGTFEILTPGSLMISTDEPVNGVQCDPTTFHALVGDSSLGSVEARFAFPMAAAGPNKVIRDKIQIGTSGLDSFGLEWGVYSYTTYKYEQVIQFGPNSELYVFGQPVPYKGGNLTYKSVFANTCQAGGNIDNHLTVITEHDMSSGTVRVDIELHGVDADTLTLGPYAMNPETQSEGIGGMYGRAPRGSGLHYMDGMVCNGLAAVITPTGGRQTKPGERNRY